MASLVDQGLLGYEDRISQHWPQFQGGGKEEVTVADLMRHEAGLASLDTPVSVEDTWTENIKRNALGAVIEAETCRYPDTGRRDYHSLTRGWVDLARPVRRRLLTWPAQEASWSPRLVSREVSRARAEQDRRLWRLDNSWE